MVSTNGRGICDKCIGTFTWELDIFGKNFSKKKRHALLENTKNEQLIFLLVQVFMSVLHLCTNLYLLFELTRSFLGQSSQVIIYYLWSSLYIKMYKSFCSRDSHPTDPSLQIERCYRHRPAPDPPRQPRGHRYRRPRIHGEESRKHAAV